MLHLSCILLDIREILLLYGTVIKKLKNYRMADVVTHALRHHVSSAQQGTPSSRGPPDGHQSPVSRFMEQVG